MGPQTFGGRVCAPAWVELMQTALPIIARAKRAHGGVEVAEASTSSGNATERDQDLRKGLEQGTVFKDICLESGMLATARCPSRKREGFPRGSEPTQACPIHGTASEEGTAGGGTPLESGGTSTGTSPGTTPPDGGGAPGPDGGTPPPTTPRARTESVSICVSTGKRATEYCPEVVVKQLPEDKIPSSCTVHRPSAGGDGTTQ
jgi:hypothetical protein